MSSTEDEGDMTPTERRRVEQATGLQTKKRKSSESNHDATPTSSTTTNGRSQRPRTQVNYSASMDEDEDEDERPDSDDEEEETRPTKKRKSSTSTKSKKKGRPTREEDDEHDEVDEDEYQDEEDDGEERKSSSRGRKRKSSNSTSRSTTAATTSKATERDLDNVEDYFNEQIENEPVNLMSEREMAEMRRRGPKKGSQKDFVYHAPDPSKVATAGILLKLRLKNFMNFTNFEIKFNPNVNFIHGMNGAGKSSILNAIQVVFGSKAAQTGRGKNIAHLISRGKESAEISVHIKNLEGPMAFKHDLYGDEIILTRKLRKTGTKEGASSTYTITGVDHRHVSKSSSELKDLCEAFNIQVENPCVVMTQEVSKKFLQSKKADDKYDFFVRATQLDQWRESIYEGHLKVGQMDETVQAHKEKIPDLERRIEQLLKQEKLAQEAEEMEQDIKRLENQMAWRRVKDLEIEYDMFDAKRTKISDDLAHAKLRLEGLQAKHQTDEEFNAIVLAHKKKLEEYAADQMKLSQQEREVTNEIQHIKHEQKTDRSRQQVWRDKNKELAKLIKQNKEKIAEIAERNSKDTRAVDEERAQKKQQLLEEKSQLETDREANTAKIAELSTEQVKLRVTESELMQQAQAEQQKINAKKGELMRLESESGAPSSSSAAAAGGKHYNPAFGPLTAQIWKEINHHKAKFKTLPIGPLGEYVEVKPEQESWLVAVTECLSERNMSTYVVDNFADQNALNAIINHVWQKNAGGVQWKPQVLILRKAARFNVIPPAVPFPLVYDCLTIEDDWAFNATVFLCKIERYGLHKDGVEAANAIRPFRASGEDPSGGNYVNGSFVVDGSRVRIVGSSKQGSTIVEARKEKPMFKVSQADRINEARQQLQLHEHAYAECKKLLQEKKAEMIQFTHQLDPLRGKNHRIGDKIRVIDAEIENLEYQAEQARNDSAKLDDTPFVDKIIGFENQIHENVGKIKASEENDQINLDKIAELTKRIEGLQRSFNELERLMDEENEQLRGQAMERAKFASAQKKYQAKEFECAKALATCEQQFGQVSTNLAVAEAQALAQCPERDDADDSLKTLMEKHDAKFQTLREKRQRQPIDIVAVREDLKSTQLAKLKAEAHIAGVLLLSNKLQQMEKDRAKRMRDCRHSMAVSANYTFCKILKLQNATGSLTFDHENRTLNMIVNPNIRDQERQDATSTVVLSGGERSVTTIAFVMAIGEQVDCPFRAIDEFDVFMDSVNRRTSMELLLSIAKARKDRQYFFLSPQDINGLNPTPYFEIHKLKDPERNQTTIDFGGEDAQDEQKEQMEEATEE